MNPNAMRTTCPVCGLDIDRADNAGRAIIARSHAHFIDIDRLVGQPGPKRVDDGEVVEAESGGRERVRDVAYLIAVAHADGVGEVVLDDPQMVAVIGDVGRQEQRVASPFDDLFAERRRFPVDLVNELVGLDDFGWLGQAVPQLREKRDVAVRRGPVVPQARVGQLPRSERGRPLDEGAGPRVVPLCARRHRKQREREQRGDGAHDAHKYTLRRCSHCSRRCSHRSSGFARWPNRCG